MSSTETKNWRGVMPPLDTAKDPTYCPVRSVVEHEMKGVVTCVENIDIDPDLGEPVIWVQWEEREQPEIESLEQLMVDLDHELGFSFVFLKYSGSMACPKPFQDDLVNTLINFTSGKVIETDKLLLAQIERNAAQRNAAQRNAAQRTAAPARRP